MPVPCLLLISEETADADALNDLAAEARLPAAVHARHSIAAALRFLHQCDGRTVNPTPRAILLDTMLSGDASAELLAHIRRHPAWRAIPIAVLDHFPDGERRGFFLAHGAAHVWRKPGEWRAWVALAPKLFRLLDERLALGAAPAPTGTGHQVRVRRRMVAVSDETRATSY